MNRKSTIIILAAAVTVLGSCTVKQDRLVCPSLFDLTICRQADSVCSDGRLWCSLWDPDGFRAEAREVPGMNVKDSTLEFKVLPRRSVLVCVTNYSGMDNCVQQGGRQYHPLYGVTEQVSCLNEVVPHRIQTLHKQYCRVTVVLSDKLRGQKRSPLVNLTAPYSGVSIPRLEPVGGVFDYTATIDDSVDILLPRQGGEGIRLTYIGGDDDLRKDTDLSAYLRDEVGYDWEEEDLRDVTIVIDVNQLDLSLVIIDWYDSAIGNFEF